ncbi:MAG: aminotransferase class III-fold pyridoxal phosphate-dependent enzyme [Nitrospirae bacterium]|nr:aminotransferase class III-fold pyridoxal phosphate-dependent enzyme [Nitrospirota bacterium]
MGTGQELYKKARRLIPGGTQLLSKRPEMFLPDLWPSYYSRAKGVHVWDMDGVCYLDMSIMGIGANILGYADDDVDNAVIEAIRKGSSSTLNCHEEVELAELLVSMHPWANMVRYTRSGGEAMAVGVRIARAKTGRDLVAFSGYHGWHDWYLSANLADEKNLDGQLMPGLSPRGVPRGLKGTSIPFFFNDAEKLESIVKEHGPEIAAVVVEPARGEDAPDDFLRALKEITSRIGAVLIFDEITSGFRMNPGGIHLRYGVNPDMAVFAKSIANGYPMAAVIGIEEVMQAAQTTFISSTNWTERIGPVAALATIKKYCDNNVHLRIIETGNEVKNIWLRAAGECGLAIKVSGLPTLAALSFDSPDNKILTTYFTQEMLERNILGFRQFKAAWSHEPSHLFQYETAVREVFALMAEGLKTGTLVSRLKTSPAHDGFFRLTKE